MVIRQKLEFSKLKLNGSRSASYFIGTSLDVKDCGSMLKSFFHTFMIPLKELLSYPLSK